MGMVTVLLLLIAFSGAGAPPAHCLMHWSPSCYPSVRLAVAV